MACFYISFGGVLACVTYYFSSVKGGWATTFWYPQCIAAYRDSHQFWGYEANFGVKKISIEGKWEPCITMYTSEVNLTVRTHQSSDNIL